MATTVQWIQYFGASKSPVSSGSTYYAGGTVPVNAPMNISSVNFYGLADSSNSTTPSPIFWGGYSCSVYVGIKHSGTLSKFYGDWYQISNIPSSLTPNTSYSIQGKAMNPLGTFPNYTSSYVAPTISSTGDSTLVNNQYINTLGTSWASCEAILDATNTTDDCTNSYWGFDYGYNNDSSGVIAYNFQTLTYGSYNYSFSSGSGKSMVSFTITTPIYSVPLRLQLNLSGYSGSAVNENQVSVGTLTYYWAES